MTLNTLDLFAGAGGFTIACEMAGGYETVAFCEIDKYAQKVLAKNWPDVPIFEDVTELKASDIDGTIDVITGGFPCQDLSAAGRRAGIGEGTRSGLFREMLRLACEIREIQGRLPYIVFENVTRLLSGPSENPGEWFGEFLWSLAEVGYDAEWFCLSAAAIGAPHKRERVCIVAYADENKRAHATGLAQFQRYVLDKTGRQEASDGFEVLRDGRRRFDQWKFEPSICRVGDGLPNQSHRLGMMGNAIVPQVFAPVMIALREAHKALTDEN